MDIRPEFSPKVKPAEPSLRFCDSRSGQSRIVTISETSTGISVEVLGSQKSQTCRVTGETNVSAGIERSGAPFLTVASCDV